MTDDIAIHAHGLTKRFDSPGTEAQVDGRPARIVERSGKKFALVVAGGALFIFETNRFESEADDRMFDRFLESVDFDVQRN